MGAAGLLHKPSSSAHVVLPGTTYAVLHEGQGTTSRLEIQPADDDVEFVTRVARPGRPRRAASGRPAPRPPRGPTAPAATCRPAAGASAASARRRSPCSARGPATAGGRWPSSGREVSVLPTTAAYDATASRPAADRADRRPPLRDATGDGTEFSSIRAFHSGDRLRRINWRVSLRTGIAARGVHPRPRRTPRSCSIVDALADYGVSQGIDGDESSLDVAMRAAAAIAEQYIRQGDRVSLRVVSTGGEYVGYGAGHPPPAPHPRPAGAGPARRPARRGGRPDRLPGRRPAPWWSCSARCSPRRWPRSPSGSLRRGLPVIVVDPLPAGRRALGVARDRPARSRRWPGGCGCSSAATCWRELAAAGCPVVPWNGPRTLEEVLRRLARRAQLPRVGCAGDARRSPAAGGRCALVDRPRADPGARGRRARRASRRTRWVVVVVAVVLVSPSRCMPEHYVGTVALASWCGWWAVAGRATVCRLTSSRPRLRSWPPTSPAPLRRTVRRGWRSTPALRPAVGPPRRAAVWLARARRLDRGRRRRRARATPASYWVAGLAVGAGRWPVAARRCSYPSSGDRRM